MDFLVEVSRLNIDEYLRKYETVICKIRTSRLKAKQIALIEMLFAQIDNEILLIKNGPLGDIKGVFSVFCPRKNFDSFVKRLFGIGYCNKFYLLDFENRTCENSTDLHSINPLVWKGRKFSVQDLYIEDAGTYEEQSAHKREFKISGGDGEVKTVFGYRGDGSELGRRSLPVEDARCMVNLSLPHKNKRMIDPFAGAGGIIYQYRYLASEGKMTSIDIDPVLEPGLLFYGSAHYVMNAAEADFPSNSFDSVITEVPFSINAVPGIINVLVKINSFLSKDGVYVIMCGKDQSAMISAAMKNFSYMLFNQEVDRKGTAVEISVWWKNKNLLPGMELKDEKLTLCLPK